MILRVIIPIHPLETDFNTLNYNKCLPKYCKWDSIVFHEIRETYTCRADVMNHGVEAFCNDTDHVMFLHCDTKLPLDYSQRLYEYFFNDTNTPFCFFRIKFDTRETIIIQNLIEYSVNNVRKEPYGDQCFAMSVSLFKRCGSFQPLLLLEDVMFYRRVYSIYHIEYDSCEIPSYIITSDRRFRTSDGAITEFSFISNVLNNRMVMILFGLGIHPNILGSWYWRNGFSSALVTKW